MSACHHDATFCVEEWWKALLLSMMESAFTLLIIWSMFRQGDTLTLSPAIQIYQLLFSVNHAAHIRIFLWKQLTFQSAFIKVRLRPGIKPNILQWITFDSIHVVLLGTVCDYTVNEPNWTASRATLPSSPSEPHLSTEYSDHTSQTNQTLVVKHARVWYGSPNVSTL